MRTKQELETAIEIIQEYTGKPLSGAIAELVRQLELLKSPAKEIRVIETKEKR